MPQRAIAQLVGEFEKPKFFVYDERICAHGRSGKRGCTKCIDVCSTGAISSTGDKVKVESHLCAGCGGCATVCPSGAMTYASPRVAELGARLKRLLAVYARAGGKDAAILFHNATEGRELVARLARRGRGLPARVIPLEVFHIASVGIDTMLGALAYGASQVLVLSGDADADEYGAAVEREMGYAQAILTGLGYRGTHLRLVRATEPGELERAVWGLEPAATVPAAATFNLANEKRGTLDFVIDHLVRQAPAPRDEVPLAAGAPFGRVEVEQGDLYALHGLRRRMPRIGAARRPRLAAAQAHRAELRAVRAVRGNLPRGRPRPGAAAAADPPGQAGGRAQPGRAASTACAAASRSAPSR